MTQEQLRQATVGELKPFESPITLVKYDPVWPENFAREAKRIKTALGERALRVEQVGSTSVPGLLAKPIIDILLIVSDSADEPSYVPALEAAGYVLRIREPDWHQHRLFKGPDTNINLHVFTQGVGGDSENSVASRLAADQPGRPRALRSHQTRPCEQEMEVRAELRRCKVPNRKSNT